MLSPLLVKCLYWCGVIFVFLQDPDNHIYLIIHNIDGPMLRGEKNQQALGQLASIPNMHLLASIDHINAPLGWLTIYWLSEVFWYCKCYLPVQWCIWDIHCFYGCHCSVWDHSKMCVFNWLWYEMTTFLPYTEETSYENSLLVQQTGALALSSLTHVLRSLTPNARYSSTYPVH